MARGYPDYFGQSMWPKYGTPFYQTGSSDVGAGELDWICRTTIQGVLVFASCTISGIDASADFTIYLDVDDETVSMIEYGNAIANGILIPTTELWVCVQYDKLAGLYSLILRREVSCRTSFDITLDNFGPTDLHIEGATTHYVVT